MKKYLVIWCLHNAKNNGWAYKVENAYDDYIDAFNKYAEVCKTYIRNGGDFDHVSVMIIDSNNAIYDTKVVDIEVVKPAPEPEVEETEEVEE